MYSIFLFILLVKINHGVCDDRYVDDSQTRNASAAENVQQNKITITEVRALQDRVTQKVEKQKEEEEDVVKQTGVVRKDKEVEGGVCTDWKISSAESCRSNSTDQGKCTKIIKQILGDLPPLRT